MKTKYNIQYFELPFETEKKILFYCYTTNTLNGFCHTVKSFNNGEKLITDTKNSYFNRTWERYDYESTLKRACNKIGKKIYNAAFIDNKLQRTF